MPSSRHFSCNSTSSFRLFHLHASENLKHLSVTTRHQSPREHKTNSQGHLQRGSTDLPRCISSLKKKKITHTVSVATCSVRVWEGPPLKTDRRLFHRCRSSLPLFSVCNSCVSMPPHTTAPT